MSMKAEYYVIAVDYYMYDEANDKEYTSKCYLYTTRNAFKFYVFNESLNYLHYDLKWFPTEDEAKKYIKNHELDSKYNCSYENCRIEKIEADV